MLGVVARGAGYPGNNLFFIFNVTIATNLQFVLVQQNQLMLHADGAVQYNI